MKRFKQYLAEEEISQSQLNALEKTLDKLFASLSIDIEFTRHFIDRVNDRRNKKKHITIDELKHLFTGVFKKHGNRITQMNPNAEAVLKDLSNQLNIPFALHINSRTQLLELISKTVLRKKEFKTSNKILRV